MIWKLWFKINSFKANPKTFQMMTLRKKERGKNTFKSISILIHKTNAVGLGFSVFCFYDIIYTRHK